MDETNTPPAVDPDWASHPHTQLGCIISDLQGPHVEIHDRIGVVHRSVLALAQLLQRDIEPPPPPEDQEPAA
jgi:hypothetical protein